MVHIIFTLIIFVFLLIGIYYYHFLKSILNKIILSIVLSIVIMLTWIVGLFGNGLITAFLIYLTLFTLCLNVIILIIQKYKKIVVGKKVYLLSIIFSLIICIYGYINMNNVSVKNYTFTSKDIKEDIKILFISDSHYGSVLKKDKLDKIMNDIYKINDIDLVLLGGDITDESTSTSDFKYIYDKIGLIKSKYGKYLVFGNHDTNILWDSFAQNEINVLDDEVFNINDNISIIGRKDYFYKRRDIKELTDSVSSNKYLIVLDHQPKDYKLLSKEKVDLVLSGHTHAGQLFPLRLAINLFKTSDMSYGNKKIGPMQAIVSSGLAGWKIPLRTSGKNEYVIINIKK